MYPPGQIAGAIDLAALKPEHTKEATILTCHTATRYQCASVCVKPCYVVAAAKELVGTGVSTGTVINFPHGSAVPDVAALEAYKAVGDGATELDMVVNIGEVLSAHWGVVLDGICAVRDIAHDNGALVKVILETCYLAPRVIKQVCRLCDDMRVDFVKTSTGFGLEGATIDDVKLMVATCKHCLVKASGGINTYKDAECFLNLGCSRLGSSRVKELMPC